MKRLLAAMVLGLALFAAAPGSVLASTGYASFSPSSASPGDAVQVAVDPYNCPVLDVSPSSVRMVLFGPDPTPGAAGPAHDVILSRATGNTYTFKVPSLPVGRYDVYFECWPDGGLEGIVTDGGVDGFRILPSVPHTSTVAPGQPSGQPSPFPAFVLLFAACVVGTSLLIGRLDRP